MKFLDKLHTAWKSDSTVLHIGLLVLIAVIWGATCGLWGMSGGDEPRYTLIAKELIENGNVFLLTLNGEPYDQKPPLIFWLFAISMKLCGGEVSSFAPRVVSAVFSLIMLGATYMCGRKVVSPKAGIYAAFILATCPVFINHVPRAKLDMVFAAFVTLAVAAIITRKDDNAYIGWLRALTLWGGLAGAFFIKGPLALLIVLVFIGLYAAFNGKGFWKSILRLRFFWGLAFVFVLIGLWLGIEVYLVGPEFVTNQIDGETVNRVTQGAHENPIWFYFAHIFEILGVWVIGLLMAFYMMFKRKIARIPQLKLWLFWFLPGFIVLCLASGKRIAYPLPLLPPLAIFIGYYLYEMSLNDVAGKLFKILSLILNKFCLVLGVVMCILSIAVYIKIGWAWEHAFYIARWSLVLACAAGVVLMLAGLWQGKARQGLGTFCGTLIFVMLLTNFLVNVAIYPSMDVHNTSRFFSQNLPLMYPELLHKPLGVTTYSDDGTSIRDVGSHRFHVYGKYKITPLVYNRDMFAEPNPDLPDYILMDDRAFGQLATPPEQGGFSLVFWDIIENKYKLRLLCRNTAPLGAEDAAKTDMEQLLQTLQPGLALTGEVLQPYESPNHEREPAQLRVTALSHGSARMYAINMRKGFAGNAYAVNWLMQSAEVFPTERALLALTNLPDRSLPYGRAFNALIFRNITEKNQVSTVFFTGPGATVSTVETMLADEIQVSDETALRPPF